eukprot:RCo019869
MTVKKRTDAADEQDQGDCRNLRCCELPLPELEADSKHSLHHCSAMGAVLGLSVAVGKAADVDLIDDELSSDSVVLPESSLAPPDFIVARQAVSFADLAELCSDEDSDEASCMDEPAGSSLLFCGVESIPPQRAEDKSKYTVVFDLDETLVFARDGTVRPRPHIDRLFEVLKNRCEVIIWTAGVKKYAQQVLERIDKTGALDFCICRHEAWYQQPCNMGKNYVKDLAVLGRDVSRTIIIENTPDNCVRNPRNSIIVSDYVRDTPSDATLAVISNVLDGLLRSNMSVPQFLSTNINVKLETLRNALGETLGVYMLA